MNALQASILGAALAMCSLLGAAQTTQVPFRKIEKDVQLSVRTVVPLNEIAASREAAPLPESSSSSGFVLALPQVKPPRTISRSFLLLNGLHLGLAVLDVELTQHCIANQKCVEGNPLMPSSRAGQLAVNFASVSYGTFASYKLKKHDCKLWTLSPIVGISAHTLGAATGIAHW